MKSFNEQINPKFIHKAKKLCKVTKFLQNILPVECHGHFQVGNFRQQILILISDSPVWTTRLRQLSPQILKYIHENSDSFFDCLDIPGSGKSGDVAAGSVNTQIVHHIQITTRYSNRQHSPQKRVAKNFTGRRELSQQSAKLLAQSADSIKHEKLKASLQKLARHAGSDFAGTDQASTDHTGSEKE